MSRKGYLNIIDYLLRDEIKSYVINCIMALSDNEVIQHIFDNHPIVEFLADDFSAATYSIKHLIDIDNVDLIKRVIDGSRFRTQLMNHIRENNNKRSPNSLIIKIMNCLIRKLKNEYFTIFPRETK